MASLTVQETGVTDCSLNSNAKTTTHDGYVNVGQYTLGDGPYRALVKFDISSIPSTAIVSAATLTLKVKVDSSGNARTLSVYRVKRAWVPAQATWNVYSTGNNWGTEGCANTTSDREATDIGTVTQPASPSAGDDLAITLTASKIQEMIDGTFTNNGFLLQVATESDDEIDYYPSEDATATNRPKLVVTYTLPAGGALFYAQL